LYQVYALRACRGGVARPRGLERDGPRSGFPGGCQHVLRLSRWERCFCGTEEAPLRTIQRAASLVGAGDTVVVRAGKYAGFQLGWDFPQNGTAAQPIIFRADPGAVITSRNGETSDGINLEGSSYVVIDGLTVDNASGNIDRACIRTVSGRNVIIRDNDVSNCGTWGSSPATATTCAYKTTRRASTTRKTRTTTVSTSPTPP
jgi:hypothetical protein